MVTDPIQHDRAKGDRRRRRSRRRVIRGASYSIYDTLSSRRASTAHASDNVGHIGFRLCLTMPLRKEA